MLTAKGLEGLSRLSRFCKLRPHLRSMEQGMEKGRIWRERTGGVMEVATLEQDRIGREEQKTRG